ncbi:MAG TPA: hypothetical protein PL158_13845 [Bacillota bacterium]|nr:hypothetical protein [Bacillota bacterium]
MRTLLIISSFCFLCIVIVFVGFSIVREKLVKSTTTAKRLGRYYALTSQWLKIKNKQKSISDYFKMHHYHSVAVYGFGELGVRLCEELIKSDIKLTCVIDRSINEAYFGPDGPKHIRWDHEPFEIDADVIVVTPVYDFEKIKSQLISKGVQINILSLSDVVFGV